MAKRTGGGGVAEADVRRLLIAAVVEYGARKVGPYTLALPARALRNADTGGELDALQLEGGGVLVTFMPERPAPKPKR
jgi:hypothetical protein